MIRNLAILFFVFLFALYSTSLMAKAYSFETVNSILVTSPPTVYSPVTYWQNCSKPLTAIASSGATLNWYLSNSATETPSAIAPTPNTDSIGSSVIYYVSQTINSIESNRVPIVVNVQADNGGTILTFRCDPSQIPNYSLNYTPPATTSNTVLFDWANNNAFMSQTYICTYSIQGGISITEFNPNNESHFIVSNLLPGQSVELTLTSASHPCIPSKTITCSVPCGAITTPIFASLPATYCLNDSSPILPTSSDNSTPITGSWSPSVVDAATMGSTVYTFTPNPILFPCANKVTQTIMIRPIEPDFTDFTICSGDAPPNLNSTSPNGVSGTWNPIVVDTMTTATYEFTPNLGQTCTPTIKTITVTVKPSNPIAGINWTVSEAFAENQIVTISDPIGATYSYQLDSGPFQASPVFEKVATGLHSVTVQDVNGCGAPITDNTVLVIGFPRYFTPNGDNINDTWNITTLKLQSSSSILIYDRYGKLLKNISPLGTGWDGTFVGKPMPSDDYWFTVRYAEQNSVKEYKSHFSLKR